MPTVPRCPTTSAIAAECRLAQLISERLLPEQPDGGTYDARSNSLAIFNDERTYLVSVPGYEHRVESVIPSAGALLPWVRRVRRRLAVEPHYLGWWRDGRELVFDISMAIDGDRDFILRLAKSWGQKAVYHPVSDATVFVPCNA